jgi:hypothetical protein
MPPLRTETGYVHLIPYQISDNKLKFVEISPSWIVMWRPALMPVAVSRSQQPIASDPFSIAMVVDGACFIYVCQAVNLTPVE